MTRTGSMDFSDVARAIDELEPRFVDMQCRIVPTSFDADDPELRPFPIPLDWEWRSCRTHLEAAHPFALMMRLPLFWQLEVPLYHAGQAAGSPIFVNDPENLPVGGVAIRDAGMEAVVTTADDALTLLRHLIDKKLPQPRLWLTISQAGAHIADTPDEVTGVFAREVHLFPGVVLLEQCSDLARKKESRFHTSPDFAWESDERDTLVTSTDEVPLPLTRYRVPLSIEPEGMCACGREVVRVR